MAALLFSYSVYIGLVYLHVIVALTILSVLCFYCFFHKKIYPWHRLTLACLLAILLSAAKLTVLLSLGRHLEHSTVLMGLIDSGDFFSAFVRTIFYSGRSATGLLHWGEHEREISLTPLPLFFIVIGLIHLFRKRRYKELWQRVSHWSASYGYVFLFLAIFTLWLPYTFLSPGFQSFYSDFYVIKHFRTAPRFLSVYIMPVIILSMYCFHKIIPKQTKIITALLSMLFVIIFVGVKDQSYLYS